MIDVKRADFSQASDQSALQLLMQHYACDPMGGGTPLADSVISSLPEQLARYPGSFSAIAWLDGVAVGLINCFETLSTFKGKPLLNVHVVLVLREHRGKGISRQLLFAVEVEAVARGCCKLTLEVLSGNVRAQQVYRDYGFAAYQLDPACGQALFMEKML